MMKSSEQDHMISHNSFGTLDEKSLYYITNVLKW